MIGAAWRIATAPTRFAVGVALDALFGKEEPFDYPLTGTTPDPLVFSVHISAPCACEARVQPSGSNACIEGDRWGH